MAGRDGSLTALNIAAKEEVWSVQAGTALRTAPLVLGEGMYVVTESEMVRAVRRGSGARLWVSEQDGYVGPPVEVGGALLVARGDGSVHQLDPATGRILHRWNRGHAGSKVYLGPSVGGGVLWFADREPAAWRLGPDSGTAARLSLAWMKHAPVEPFLGDLLRTAPVAFRDRAVVLDHAGVLYLVDPRTGEGRKVGALPGDVASRIVEPAVAGEAALAAVGSTLHALRLPDGRPLWSFTGEGTSFRPPTVASDIVLWTTQAEVGGKLTTGHLYALDLATGRLRWSAALPPFWMAAEPTVRGGVVYLGTPPSARDLRTGRMLWQAAIPGAAGGAPVLGGRVDLLYTALNELEANAGSVVALETRGGAPRWRAELGKGEVLHPAERLWLSEGTLIVPSFSGCVIGLDAATGRERWRYTPASPRFGAVTVEGGRVLFAQRNGKVVSLAAATGEPTVHSTDLEELLEVNSKFQRPLRIGDRLLIAVGSMLLGFEFPRP